MAAAAATQDCGRGYSGRALIYVSGKVKSWKSNGDISGFTTDPDGTLCGGAENW
jgi:hypothetical protein